jgi:hypothetical protein
VVDRPTAALRGVATRSGEAPRLVVRGASTVPGAYIRARCETPF